MQKDIKSKQGVKRLEEVLLDGQVVNRKWLQNKGYERTAIDYYMRSGKLESVGRGIYRRYGPLLKWEHLVYSFQEMGTKLHIGGQSALELQGFTHYLSLKNALVVSLYTQQLP